MEESAIRARVRAMVQTGEIPCDEPAEMWGGSGTGHRCAACGLAIPATDKELEVELASGQMIRLHPTYYVVWMDECQSLTETAP